MESFYSIILTVVLVLSVFVAPVYLVGTLLDIFEKKYKRSKFKVSYTLAFNEPNELIEFKDAESLAIKAGLKNSQAVIALDELRSQIVEEKNKNISKIQLDKVQGQFRVLSTFDKIPENLRGHIDKLRLLVPENNADLFALEEEIQNISKTKQRYKLFSLFVALVTIVGTIYTILGYFKIGI